MNYSVLMSVYKNDSPEQLEEALKSIYDDQIRKPDEIVVVFDGPLTEALYHILDAFAEDKEAIVRYIPLEENHGLGEALRIGSEHCKGDYILRMDADDISHPQRFEKQIAFVEAHPEVDVLGTDVAEFEVELTDGTRVRACPVEHDAIVRMAKKRNPMNHVSVCIKRQALIDCGGYEEIPLLEDYYLWLKMITTGRKLANLHESLVFVRLGNDFNKKRGSRHRARGWSKLQRYMLQHKLINRWDAMTNMIFIYGFVYCPSFVRKLAYTLFLRG